MTSTRRFPFPSLVFGGAPKAAPVGADPDAFRRRILPHLDPAYGYARHLARDASAAEDIVQEAFLRAFRAIESCRGNEKSWLLAIVRNCHLDWAAKNGRYQGFDEAAPETADGGDSPLEQLERESDIARVRATIEALPEPFREALILRELEGLAYLDIAEISRAPIGTVMSRLARARQMLAALLRDSETPATKGATGR